MRKLPKTKRFGFDLAIVDGEFEEPSKFDAAKMKKRTIWKTVGNFNNPTDAYAYAGKHFPTVKARVLGARINIEVPSEKFDPFKREVKKTTINKVLNGPPKPLKPGQRPPPKAPGAPSFGRTK
jgi:hypothetical protein